MIDVFNYLMQSLIQTTVAVTGLALKVELIFLLAQCNKEKGKFPSMTL